MPSNRTIQLLIVISATLIMGQLTTEQRIYCAQKQSQYSRILSGCVFFYTPYRATGGEFNRNIIIAYEFFFIVVLCTQV